MRIDGVFFKDTICFFRSYWDMDEVYEKSVEGEPIYEPPRVTVIEVKMEKGYVCSGLPGFEPCDW